MQSEASCGRGYAFNSAPTSICTRHSDFLPQNNSEVNLMMREVYGNNNVRRRGQAALFTALSKFVAPVSIIARLALAF